MTVKGGPDGRAGPMVEVADLSVEYRDARETVRAVDSVSFTVQRGEIFGLAGETGCGKSTVLRAVVGLLHPNARVVGGHVTVAGERVTGANPSALRRLRSRRVAMVFQDPLRSLNPVLTIEEQIGEGLRTRERIGRRELRTRVLEAMQAVGIPDAARRLGAYPHELSGGLQQRAVIAACLIRSPELILADEPTTALDVTIQDQILGLLRDLCRDYGMSVILVTHDIGVVAETCHRVGVMYAGRLVEIGAVTPILATPSHPYTAGLLASIPRIGTRQSRLKAIPGSPPDLSQTITGCPFAPRCAYVVDACRSWAPVLSERAPDQATACLRHAELSALTGSGE